MKHPFTSRTFTVTAILAALSLAHASRAQDAIPLEEAQKIARKLVEASTPVSDQPIAVEVDADKPAGLKGGEAGLIVLPDKRLTADTFANAGKTTASVAQLWTYKVNLVSSGKSVDSSKIRVITVGDGDKSKDVQLFLVGVAKNDQGALELVIFGKGTEPILRAPLAKLHDAKQDLPIEISGRKNGEDSALLTLDLPGGYTAEIVVAKAGE